MAKASFWQKGERLDYANGGTSAIEANTIIVLGTKIGVAGSDIAVGETGALYVEGVFSMPKSDEAAITAGAAVYWDGSGITATASGNTPAGFAAQAAAAADETILVKINA